MANNQSSNEYPMDVELQKRNTLIILGTLSGLGVIIAFLRTWKWFSGTERQIVDLPVRISYDFTLKKILYCNRLSANLSFIYLVLLVLFFYL